MTADDVIAALALPPQSLVGRRVPKALLLDNSSPTTADKRQIREGLEELEWVAALKPSTIGVPAFSDEHREYLEIAVMRMTVRPGSRRSRLAVLLHRSIPYPVFLVVADRTALEVALVHKRRSQGEARAIVLEGAPVVVALEHEAEDPYWKPLRAALPLAKQTSTSLERLYQSWLDTVLAYSAARLTGEFSVPASDTRARRRQSAMEECARLESEIELLRRRATKETQIARAVEFNGELTRLHAELAAARKEI